MVPAMRHLAKALVVARIQKNEKAKHATWGAKRGPWDKKIKKADGGPVTDPDILAQLNAPTPVNDPAILAQLNGTQAPNQGPLSNTPDDSYLSSGAKSVGTAAIKGLSNSPGTAGNLGNFADYRHRCAHSFKNYWSAG